MPELRVCNTCGVLHAGKGAHCEQCKRRRPKQQATYAPIYGTKQWKRARQQALERDNDSCTKCGSYNQLIVHHRVEIGPGIDPYDVDNLQTLCRRCHRGEHNRRRTHERKLQ